MLSAHLMLSRDLIFFYIDALGRSCLGGNL